MLRKNVARFVAMSALSVSLLIPSSLAFATDTPKSTTTNNSKIEAGPLVDDKEPSKFSGSTTSQRPALDLETLLETKRAEEKARQAKEAEEAAQEPSPEEIRQQQITSLVETAKSLQGVPYWYGGTTPNGFDCSGFTQYVFSQSIGVELPRTAAEQSYTGTPVSFEELMEGDLVFWGSGSGVYHVGIYVGNWSYIHADCSVGITIASMDSFTPSFAMRVL